MLTPDQYRTARDLFARAREAGAPSRADILAACDDPAVREEVSALLAIDEADSGFLRDPAMAEDAAREAAAALLSDDEDTLVGRQIDDFQVRRVIASGGMGTVYLAQQVSTDRPVALKLLRLGMTSTQALRRFEYETRILARLRHPNIAQIHNSGAWDTGACRVPWFAMEYVSHSVTIIEYARRNHLPRRDRIELFLTVCDAVSHGHQKGVIHRDLKPANILVEDAAGPRGPMAKVIDFGVAKCTDADLALTTMHTNAGQLIGTLPYMSPEQCVGDADQVDVRCDVYSLGVVLYELLTDHLPFDVRNRSAVEAARIVQHTPPARPSSHQADLRGDLETIILKAIDKDRQQRYQGVNELRADLVRFLSSQPIEASPPTLRRQLTLFARRHRPVVAAAAMVAAAMLVAVAVSTSFGVTAQAEASARRIEQRRAQDINRFLREMLLLSDPDRGEGPDLTVAEMLDRAAAQIDERLDDPLAEAGIHLTVSEAYDALGRFDDAFHHASIARDLYARFAPAANPERLHATTTLARCHLRIGEFEQCETLLRQVIGTGRPSLGVQHDAVRQAMALLGRSLAERGLYREARSLFEEALVAQIAAVGEDDPETWTLRNSYAVFLERIGELKEAEAIQRDILARRTQALGERHPSTLTTLHNLGTLLRSQGRYDEALPCLETVVAARREILPDGHPDTLTSMNNLGIIYQRLGRLDEARALAEETYNARRRLLGDNHMHTLTAGQNLARVLQRADDLDGAETLLREIVRLSRERFGPAEPGTIAATGDLGVLLLQRRETEEAERLLREVFIEASRVLPPDHWHVAKYETLMAMAMAQGAQSEPDDARKAERFAEAETLMRHAETRLQELVGPDHPQTKYTRRKLVMLYEDLGREEDAALFRDEE